jgi:quercetin dioxygenase-like cupin family protein
MRKLLGLFSVCALVGVAAGVNGAGATPPSGQFSSTEHGRAQQDHDGTVVAASGRDVLSGSYTIAPGGDTGWRSNQGSVAVALLKGVLTVQYGEECATTKVPAGKTYLLPSGAFRLRNTDKDPVELLGNFTNLPSGSPALDEPSGLSPACSPEEVPPTGVSASNSFRGDVSAYFRQAHAGHGDGGADYSAPTKELSVQKGKDAFMVTFLLQPGFSTGWFAHTEHVAIITKGTWAFYEGRDGKCEKVEEYKAGDAWVHHVHRHLGAVQGNEPVEITLFGFNLKHGEPMPVFGSNPDHLDFAHSPPSECPTQVR